MDFLVNSRVETEVIMGYGILCDREKEGREEKNAKAVLWIWPVCCTCTVVSGTICRRQHD